MCMSSYAEYHPRPVREETFHRPEGAAVTSAEADSNLFGPKPMPPAWTHHPHDHDTHEMQTVISSVSGGKTTDAGGVIVELSNGTRLLICPV
jgi:hypothetical protein